jgi:hypothetical protein
MDKASVMRNRFPLAGVLESFKMVDVEPRELAVSTWGMGWVSAKVDREAETLSPSLATFPYHCRCKNILL